MALFSQPTKQEATEAFADALRTGRFDKAIKLYRKLIKKAPEDHELHNDLGYCLLEIGQVDDAVAHLGRSVALRQQALNTNNLGRALLARGDFVAARQAFETTRRLDPDDPQSWYNLTVCIREAGDMEGSFEELLTFVDAHPEHIGGHGDLAMHYEIRGDNIQAIDHLNAALTGRPGDVSLRLNVARLLCEADRFDECGDHLGELGKLGLEVTIIDDDARLLIEIDGKIFFQRDRGA